MTEHLSPQNELVSLYAEQAHWEKEIMRLRQRIREIRARAAILSTTLREGDKVIDNIGQKWELLHIVSSWSPHGEPVLKYYGSLIHEDGTVGIEKQVIYDLPLNAA